MIERLADATFSPHVDDTFAVTTPAGSVPLRLVSVTTREQHVPGAPQDWTPFTLHFVGPVEPMLDQRTWQLAHDATGPLEIFLVPIARDADGTRYEAVFG